MTSSKELRRKRLEAGLSIGEVSGILGRTRAWLSALELGRIAMTETTATRIEEAIERLNALRKGTGRRLGDLALPRAKNRRTE